MADRYDFTGSRRLVDVTVTKVKAGGTHTTSISGTKTDNSGTSNITTINGTAVMQTTALAGDFGDLTDLIIIGAVDSTGGFPDCQIQPYVDGKALGDLINIDGSAYGNMFPNPANAVGFLHVSLGIKFREALRKHMANLPMKATGLKAYQQYQFQVSSTLGWGNAATAKTPLRIIGFGDKLDKAAVSAAGVELQNLLNKFAAGESQYNPLAIADQVEGFSEFVSFFSLPGGLTDKTWTGLMGGQAQKGTAVDRFFRVSYNTTATPANGIFPLTNSNVFGGDSNYVGGTDNDLGFDYESGTTAYLKFLEFGVHTAANLAFVGYQIGKQVFPDNPSGYAVTDGVNPYPFGIVQPQRTSSNLYYAMRRMPWPLVAWKNKVSFFVVANGTAIPAQFNADNTTLQDCAGIAVGGVKVVPAA